jgi:hypothetical protein
MGAGKYRDHKPTTTYSNIEELPKRKKVFLPFGPKDTASYALERFSSSRIWIHFAGIL